MASRSATACGSQAPLPYDFPTSAVAGLSGLSQSLRVSPRNAAGKHNTHGFTSHPPSDWSVSTDRSDAKTARRRSMSGSAKRRLASEVQCHTCHA